MMKRTLALVLSLCLLLGTLDCAAFAEGEAGPEALSVGSSGTGIRRAAARAATGGQCGDGLTYTFDGGKLTISYTRSETETGFTTGKMNDYEALSDGTTENAAPWKKTESTVGPEITEIIIEDGVTSIGNNAFWSCASLSGVTLPESVTSIGEAAFADCTALEEISIPVGATSIGNNAFGRCTALKSITIPSSVTSISANAFAGCNALQNVTYLGTREQWDTLSRSVGENNEPLKNAAIRYSDGSFGGVCGSGLTWSLSADGTTLTISGAGEMTNYTSASLVPWRSGAAAITTLQLPDGLTSIGSMAFSGCEALQAVTIPSGVKTIGDFAFSGCKALQEITLPFMVTAIGTRAFEGCSGLKEAVIPGGISAIPEELFLSCDALERIELPAALQSVGARAFGDEPASPALQVSYASTKAHWEALKENIGAGNNRLLNGQLEYQEASGSCGGTTLMWKLSADSSTLTLSGAGDMDNYSGVSPAPWSVGAKFITSIAFPEDLMTSIGSYAFYGCSGVAEITIPKSIGSIGESAFGGWDALTHVTYTGTEQEWNEQLNIEVGNDALNNASFTFEAEYPTSGTCGDNLSWVLGEDGTLTISGTGAMEDYVVDGASPQYAPWYNNRDDIQNVVIQNGATSIGNNAFYSCGALKSVSIPASATSMGDGAFNGCSALTGIIIPDSVTSMGDLVFNNCRALSSITIPKNVKSIGISAFAECRALSSITIPEGVESIGAWAFNDCFALESIVIPDSVMRIGVRAFYGCSGLSSIAIPNGVTNINDYTFYNCEKLKDITIPNSVTSISDGAFSNCSLFTDVYYGGTKAQWDNISIGSMDNGPLTDATIHYAGGLDGGSCGENLSWALGEDGTLTISGTGNMENYLSSADVPWQAYQADTKKIVIEDGVTSIGMNAFSGFAALTQMTIPEGVKSIGESAFYGCGALAEITIAQSVTAVGMHAFAQCTTLSDVTYSGTKAQWAEQVAIDSTGNDPLTGATIHCADGDIGAGITYLLHFDANEGDANSVPKDQTLSGGEGMTGAKFLVSAEAPTRAGYDFLGWAYTSTAAEPEVSPGEEILLLPEEPERTLYAVWALQRGADSCGENLTWSLSEDGTTLLIAGTGAMDNYSEENPAPWSGSAGTITRIQLPEGMTSIGHFAFSGCSALQEAVIPSTVTAVGARAFGNCTALTELLTSEGLTRIYDEAFLGCPALKSVHLPASLQGVGYDAFSGCGGLTDVYYAGTEAQWKELSGAGGGISSGNGALTGAAVHCSDSGGTDTPDTPQGESLLQIDGNLEVASGKTLHILTGIDIRVQSGVSLKVGGSLSAAGKLQNEGTLTVDGQLQAAGGIESSGTLALSAGEITASSAKGTICGESGQLRLSGGTVTNTGEGPALSLTGSAPASWNISSVIRSKAAHPVTLDGVPYLPDGYRVQQEADGFYYLRQN